MLLPSRCSQSRSVDSREQGGPLQRDWVKDDWNTHGLNEELCLSCFLCVCHVFLFYFIFRFSSWWGFVNGDIDLPIYECSCWQCSRV